MYFEICQLTQKMARIFFDTSLERTLIQIVFVTHILKVTTVYIGLIFKHLSYNALTLDKTNTECHM